MLVMTWLGAGIFLALIGHCRILFWWLCSPFYDHFTLVPWAPASCRGICPHNISPTLTQKKNNPKTSRHYRGFLLHFARTCFEFTFSSLKKHSSVLSECVITFVLLLSSLWSWTFYCDFCPFLHHFVSCWGALDAASHSQLLPDWSTIFATLHKQLIGTHVVGIEWG